MSDIEQAGDDAPAGAPDADRCFQAQGRSWSARLAGVGLGGTGRLGMARLGLVHFIAAGESAPRFQALIASGRFQHLHERELADLLARAQPLPPPPPASQAPPAAAPAPPPPPPPPAEPAPPAPER